jgi:hypothetical protein
MTVACATPVSSLQQKPSLDSGIVFGRALTVLMGQSTRTYEPEVRFIELVNRSSKERFRVDVRSDDKRFVFQLPAGEYELSRVQITEGPFMSMADFVSTFQVEAEGIVYLGTWRFGVDVPRYGRMVMISAIQDQEDQAEAEHQLLSEHPDLEGRLIAAHLPNPASAESRLYEVMPYPYYPRYFRRHWW